MSLVKTICHCLGCFYFLNEKMQLCGTLHVQSENYKHQAGKLEMKAMYQHVITVCDVLFTDLKGEGLLLIFEMKIKLIEPNSHGFPHFLEAKDNLFHSPLIVEIWLFCDLFAPLSCERNKRPFSFWFVVIHWTDSAGAAAAAVAAVEKMIMVYNQELFWCNGVPTKHDKALKWIQSLRGHILPTNKPAGLAASLPMAISHLHVSCAHSPVGLLLT